MNSIHAISHRRLNLGSKLYRLPSPYVTNNFKVKLNKITSAHRQEKEAPSHSSVAHIFRDNQLSPSITLRL